MANSNRPSPTIGVPAAAVLPALVILFTLCNGLFNSLATAFGYGFPFDTFCFSAHDILADFLKSALSYPGPAIHNLEQWPALYRDYLAHNPYGGVAALADGKLSNLHGMPLPTLLLLEARRALAFRDPNLVTWAFFTAALAPFCLFVWLALRKTSVAGLAVLSYLLSYPLIFAVTRGNITAVLLGEALAVAVFLSWRGRHLWIIALLLALAVNLRPNAGILLALPLVSWPWRNALLAGVAAGAAALVMFTIALAAAHHLYPDYTFGHFTQAVMVYRKDYIAGDGGLYYGSSLLGGMKFVGLALFGSAPTASALELASSFLGLAAFLLWLFLAWQGRLERTAGVFTLLAIYVLFSDVFGDYHLIVFFGIVLIYGSQVRNPFSGAWSDGLIGGAALTMLVPKNYIFWQDLSVQVLLNPLVLLIAILILGVPFRAHPSREAVEQNA